MLTNIQPFWMRAQAPYSFVIQYVGNSSPVFLTNNKVNYTFTAFLIKKTPVNDGGTMDDGVSLHERLEELGHHDEWMCIHPTIL